MRITIVPNNEDDMHLWEEKGPLLLDELRDAVSSYDPSIKVKLHNSEYGAGASWPSIILEVLEIGGLVLLGVPAIHKKIRETISEWKKMKANIDKLISWLKKNKTITTTSIEIAYLSALEHLAKKTDVNELEVLEAQEILGNSGFIEPKFENSEIIYYFFKFRNDNIKLYSLIIDGYLNIHSDVELHLDPFQKFLEESEQSDENA